MISAQQLNDVARYFDAIFKQKTEMKVSILETLEETLKNMCAVVEYVMQSQTKVGDTKKKLVLNYLYDFI